MNWKPLVIVALGVGAVVVGIRPWGNEEDFESSSSNAPDRSNAPKTEDWNTPEFLSGDPLPLIKEGVKITTWNLHWFPGHRPGEVPESERLQHIELVVNSLQKIDADILCLQEVKDPSALKILAEKLNGMNIQMVSNFSGSLEIAILSKPMPEAAFAEEFLKAEASPPRGFAFAAFRRGNHIVLLYSVHLKSNIGGIDATAPVREESARQLLAHAEHQQAHYREKELIPVVVICGDFNTDPTREEFLSDNTLKLFSERGFVCAFRGMERDDMVTWLSNGRYPDAVFDQFLFLPAKRVSFGRPEVLGTTRDVSDHRPVSMVIHLTD